MSRNIVLMGKMGFMIAGGIPSRPDRHRIALMMLAGPQS